jgi:DNA-directed RNA polymerase subunit alpha
VTAGDITKNSQVEIKNPELVLAHITDEGGSLEMDIVVKEGRGYKLAEGVKKENREIGYIELDSIFSPVISVSISVENTRVGKMTNWDKLIRDVKTDGTLSAENAFNEAVKILVDQYASFLPKSEAAEMTASQEEMAAEPVEEVKTEEAPEEDESKETKKEKKERKKRTKK